MEATVYNPVLRKTVQLPVTFWGRSVSLCRWKCNNFLLPSCKSSKSLVRKKKRWRQWICVYIFGAISWQALHTKACAHTCTLVCTHRHTYRQSTVISSHIEPRAGTEMPTFSSTPPLHTPRMLFSLLAMASPSFLADFSPSVENQSMWCCLREAFLPQPSRSGLVIYSCVQLSGHH